MGAFDFIFKIGMETSDVDKKTKDVEKNFAKAASAAASGVLGTLASASGLSGVYSHAVSSVIANQTSNFGAGLESAFGGRDSMMGGMVHSFREKGDTVDRWGRIKDKVSSIASDQARLGLRFDSKAEAGMIGIIGQQEQAADEAARSISDKMNEYRTNKVGYGLDYYKIFQDSMNQGGAKPWR